MSSNEAFTKIMDGLIDAIAIARGEADPITYVVHDFRAMRQDIKAKFPKTLSHLTQSENDESAPQPKPRGA